jgi:hypothetical protein
LYLIIIMDTGFTLVPHISYFVCYVVFSVHPIRLYLIIIIDTGCTLVPTHISYFQCILSVCILLCRLNQVNCGTSYIHIYRMLSVSVCYLSSVLLYRFPHINVGSHQ